MSKKETNQKDRLAPYRWLYLVMSAISMLINGGLAAHFLFYEGANEQYKGILICLLGASMILIPTAVVLVFLDKCPPAFFVSLAASLIIVYAGFFLWIRSQTMIPFKTIFFYQGSSLILPVVTAVFWRIYHNNKKKNMKMIFAKTERDREKKTPSILD